MNYEGEKFMNVMETAKFLCVSVEFLNTDRGTKKYNIPYYKIGRRVVYRKSELLQWLESQRIQRPVQQIVQEAA